MNFYEKKKIKASYTKLKKQSVQKIVALYNHAAIREGKAYRHAVFNWLNVRALTFFSKFLHVGNRAN